MFAFDNQKSQRFIILNRFPPCFCNNTPFFRFYLNFNARFSERILNFLLESYLLSKMGISGLIPFLDPVLEDVHIRQYSGKKVAIDGRTWLYRGAFGCAFELCMNLNTNKYV